MQIYKYQRQPEHLADIFSKTDIFTGTKGRRLLKKTYFCSMKKIILLFILLYVTVTAPAQRNEILDKRLHTLQVVVNDDPLLPPIMTLGGHNHVEISFDEFSHEYHRYIYKVEHCNADWTPSDEIFESDFLNGFNDNPIEDGETIDGIQGGRMSRKIQWKCRYEDALIQPPREVLDINMGKFASGTRKE